MERLTKKTAEGYVVKAATLQETGKELIGGEAIERLARFEDYAEALAAGQESMAAELEALRAAGKKNTVKFKELLGKKLMDSNALALLQVYGIR